MKPTILFTAARQRVGLECATFLAKDYDVCAFTRHPEDCQKSSAIKYVLLNNNYDFMNFFHEHTVHHIIHTASMFEYDDVSTFNMSCYHNMMNVHLTFFIQLIMSWHACGGTGSAIAFTDQKISNLNPDHLSYTLSKVALSSAIPVLAQALLGRIRVNAIAPGLLLPSGGMSLESFEKFQSDVSYANYMLPDVLAMTKMLIEAPSITGQTLTIDAGQHLISDRDIIYRYK